MLYNNNKTSLSSLEIVHPHTIKKFELIEKYVESWAQILLQYQSCEGIIFIDCMCNSGVYQDDIGNQIFGTPIRVSNYLSKIMNHYPQKQALLYFNDNSPEKIKVLKNYLPSNTHNFHIDVKIGDGNNLLKDLAKNFNNYRYMNYLLIYDPYIASIDWHAIMPYLHHWGEVIINHMVNDSIRNIKQAKTDYTIAKYERTYLSEIDQLRNCPTRETFESRIKDIIINLHGTTKKYYIASFPFFNKRNALVYNLIHCSGNLKGFRLFKNTAWKTFGGKSSLKNTFISENQLMFDINNNGSLITNTDDYCYYIKDIAKYLHEKFNGQKSIPLAKIWDTLDAHPVFPSNIYRQDIKNELKRTYGDIIGKSTITFTNRRSEL